jgi:ribosomal protein S3AE
MATAKNAKAAAQLIKKRWTPILAPKIFNEAQIGESFLAEPATAVGRKITVSMMAVTGEPSQQAINLGFVISGAEHNKLQTEFVEYHIIPPATRRLMRRGRDKIEDSFQLTTGDGAKIRVKPFILTRTKAVRSVRGHIQRKARELLTAIAGQAGYDEFCRKLFDHTLQEEVGKSLRKVYPVHTCEIRWLKRLSPPTGPAPQPKPAAEPAKPEAPAAAAPEQPAEQAPAA